MLRGATWPRHFDTVVSFAHSACAHTCSVHTDLPHCHSQLSLVAAFKVSNPVQHNDQVTLLHPGTQLPSRAYPSDRELIGGLFPIVLSCVTATLDRSAVTPSRANLGREISSVRHILSITNRLFFTKF